MTGTENPITFTPSLPPHALGPGQWRKERTTTVICLSIDIDSHHIWGHRRIGVTMLSSFNEDKQLIIRYLDSLFFECKPLSRSRRFQGAAPTGANQLTCLFENRKKKKLIKKSTSPICKRAQMSGSHIWSVLEKKREGGGGRRSSSLVFARPHSFVPLFQARICTGKSFNRLLKCGSNLIFTSKPWLPHWKWNCQIIAIRQTASDSF